MILVDNSNGRRLQTNAARADDKGGSANSTTHLPVMVQKNAAALQLRHRNNNQ